MSTTFFKEGNTYQPGRDNPKGRFNKLPTGTYIVRASMERGFFLEEFPEFDLPGKLYGNVENRADRIIKTFQDRPRTTGILLSGEKGSGKTLLARMISIEGAKLGIPTIIVSTPYTGDAFNTFLQSISQQVIVLFDEFEKVYDVEEQQPQLLSLFDGFFTTQKLIVLTANDSAKVNSHFLNRPGRIYYYLDFKGLDKDFILEYGKDNLKNLKHLPSLGVISSMVHPLSFDSLQAIIEESNRYDESPTKVLDMLNVRSVTYKETFLGTFTPAKKVTIKAYDTYGEDSSKLELRVDPYQGVQFIYYVAVGKSTKTVRAKFTTDDLVSFDGITSIFHFKNKDGELHLHPKPVDVRTQFEKVEGKSIIEDYDL